MGCFNCFKSKGVGDDVEPNRPRENPLAQSTNETTHEKSLAPKTSNEPTVEEVEHSRERNQEPHSSELRASSPIITRDFGAVATDPSSTSQTTSPAKTSPPTSVLSLASLNEHEGESEKRLEGSLPPRSTSLESRGNPEDASISPKADRKKAQADESTTNVPPEPLADANQEPSASKTSEDTKNSLKLDATTEVEDLISDDKIAAEIPLPASPTSPISPTLPSLSTSVPSVSDRKSPSMLSPPSIDDINIHRLSQDSSSLLPSDFLAEEDKPKAAPIVVQNPTPPTVKLTSPKSPPLIIPQSETKGSSEGSRPAQKGITMDAPTPTSASSASRPDNLLRMSTAPSPVATSPTAKDNKRKSRLSRFMSTGGVNKRKSQAMPAAKNLKTIEDMPPTPKYIPTAVPDEKKQVRDVKIEEKEMERKELELETPATIDSVTGRTWKADGDNDSLFCY
ncbi:MAG: hypothetical protein Q9160_003190 [Pyrenula sp. 1 TL-2023]